MKNASDLKTLTFQNLLSLQKKSFSVYTSSSETLSKVNELIKEITCKNLCYKFPIPDDLWSWFQISESAIEKKSLFKT